MKAGIYLGRKNIEVREFDMPEVRENDVLIQNIYSSMNLLEGNYYYEYLWFMGGNKNNILS